MSSTLIQFQQFFNPVTGAFLAGGKVYSYEAGSSTPKFLHTTSVGDVNQTNPVILDSYGKVNGGIWGSGNYKIVVKDSTDAITVLTIDDIAAGAVGGSSAAFGNFTVSANTITAASGNDVIFQTATTGSVKILGNATQAGKINLYENTANGTNYVQITPPASITANRTITLPDIDLTQWLVQYVYTQTGAVATGTTVTVNDDTIPQNTEGDEYMTLAITPKNVNNILKIEVVWNGSSSAATNVMQVSLFQDSTANALASVPYKTEGSAGLCNIPLTHWMTAGTTSATTFKVRAGLNAAGTTTFNGASSGRLLGGVMASSICITEYTP